MSRRFWTLGLALLAMAGFACDDDEEAAEGPEAFEEMRTHIDLLERAHLADIDHHGTFIDFGTPARMKYTVGQWRTGWVSDESSGDVTFSYVGDTGRVFFQVDQAGPVTLRFRAKPVGSRNLSLFLNGNQQELIRLEEGDQFRDYDITIAAEHVEVGENYLLMRFGGTEMIDGQPVAAAIESIRVVEGASIPGGEFEAPRYGQLVQEMMMGEESRRAIALRRPTTVSFYEQIPAGARLGFGTGAEGAAANVKVFATAEGGSRTQLYAGQANGEWQDQVVDLAAFAGKVARIDFVAEGEGDGRVGFSLPRILLPKIEETEREPARNVVVLLVDTLRAEKLKPFNPRSRVQTPRLEALAGESSLFLGAQSAENWTKPSVASVLTGLFPTSHGAKESESRLSDEALLLSEHLHDNGFATGSFIANGYVSDRFGFDQGWDHYTNFIRENKSTDAENVFQEAGDWIEAHKDERFFAYVQTIDPHVPYDPPDRVPADVRLARGLRGAGDASAARRSCSRRPSAARSPSTQSDRQRLAALHDGEISQHDHDLGRSSSA